MPTIPPRPGAVAASKPLLPPRPGAGGSYTQTSTSSKIVNGVPVTTTVTKTSNDGGLTWTTTTTTTSDSTGNAAAPIMVRIPSVTSSSAGAPPPMPKRPTGPSSTPSTLPIPPRPAVAVTPVPVIPPQPNKPGAVKPIEDWHPALKKLREAGAHVDPAYKGPQLNLAAIDFSSVDKFAVATPASNTHDYVGLAKYLTSTYKDDVDKYRSIFAWMGHNIAYDADHFFHRQKNPQDPESVLRNRKGVCVGYARLFEAMCTVANLYCEVVSGAARGAGSAPADTYLDPNGHAWNVVLVKGKYRFIDCTWGAGHLNGMTFSFHFNPYWFLLTPHELIFTHIPGENHAHQFLTPPLTHQEWLSLPFCDPIFHALGFRLVSFTGHKHPKAKNLLSYSIVDDDRFELVLEVPLSSKVNVEGDPKGWKLFSEVRGGLRKRNNTPQGKLIWLDGDVPHKHQLDIGGSTSSKATVRWKKTGVPNGYIQFIIRGVFSPGEGFAEVSIAENSVIKPGVTFPTHRLISFRVMNTGKGHLSGPAPTVYSSPFNLLKPVVKQLHKNDRHTFKLQVPHTDVGKQQPRMFLIVPDGAHKPFEKSQNPSDVEDGIWVIRDICFSTTGKVQAAWETGPNRWSFMAEFEVVN